MDRRGFDTSFEQFLANIVLTESQANRIDDALTSISTLFLEEFEGDVEIYVQGSFATNTTVKPLTDAQSVHGPGEFDIDIVLEKKNWKDAVTALEIIEKTLLENTSYSSKVSSTKKQSCVRLEYAPNEATGVGFHVDIVPIIHEFGSRRVAIRNGNIWKISDSIKLIEWTKTKQGQLPYLTASILMLKRLRDMARLTEDITSIVLFSLLDECYAQQSTYADDLTDCIKKINNKLSVGIDNLNITNPVNKEEDLVGKWRSNPNIFYNVLKFFNTINEYIPVAIDDQATDVLRELISDDFPLEVLPEYVKSLRSIKITVAGADEIKKGKIEATSRFGKKVSGNIYIFFERNKPIKFVAKGTGIGENILWQVANDPRSESVRGGYFQARELDGGFGSSADPRINHENETYPGKHWIRFVSYDSDNHLSTLSNKFFVEVRVLSKGFRSAS